MITRFSERIGKRAPRAAIQIDTMDDDLRNGLWNEIYLHFVSSFAHAEAYEDTNENPLFTLLYYLWTDLLKFRADEIPYRSSGISHEIKQLFFSKWDAFMIYDVIDFLSQSKHPKFRTEQFIVGTEQVLRRELSGYGFINGALGPFISAQEVASIEMAIDNTDNVHYRGAFIHLSTALEKLSDRREPDYRNSIKESISAVESVCQAIIGDSKATLGPALKKLEQKIPIHGALKEGLLKIYGYTSDGDGIRHALQEESTLGQEDALFMLVTCSAFVNYLTVKADKAGA
jgi:hypothetical protein